MIYIVDLTKLDNVVVI